jgi:hypothetical protein
VLVHEGGDAVEAGAVGAQLGGEAVCLLHRFLEEADGEGDRVLSLLLAQPQLVAEEGRADVGVNGEDGGGL